MKTLHVTLICATALASAIIISQPKPVPSPVKYEQVLDMAKPVIEPMQVQVQIQPQRVHSLPARTVRVRDRRDRSEEIEKESMAKLLEYMKFFDSIPVPREALAEYPSSRQVIRVQHEFPYHLGY